MIKNNNSYDYNQPTREIIEEVRQRLYTDTYSDESTAFILHTYKLAYWIKPSKQFIIELGAGDNGKTTGNLIRNKAINIFGNVPSSCLIGSGSSNLSDKHYVDAILNGNRVLSIDEMSSNHGTNTIDSNRLKLYTGGNAEINKGKVTVKVAAVMIFSTNSDCNFSVIDQALKTRVRVIEVLKCFRTS